MALLYVSVSSSRFARFVALPLGDLIAVVVGPVVPVVLVLVGSCVLVVPAVAVVLLSVAIFPSFYIVLPVDQRDMKKNADF